MGEGGLLGTITVDKMPDSITSADIVTRISDNEVVIRLSNGLWVLRTKNPLDAEFIAATGGE